MTSGANDGKFPEHYPSKTLNTRHDAKKPPIDPIVAARREKEARAYNVTHHGDKMKPLDPIRAERRVKEAEIHGITSGAKDGKLYDSGFPGIHKPIGKAATAAYHRHDDVKPSIDPLHDAKKSAVIAAKNANITSGAKDGIFPEHYPSKTLNTRHDAKKPPIDPLVTARETNKKKSAVIAAKNRNISMN